VIATGAEVRGKFACGFLDRAGLGKVPLAPDEGFPRDIAAGLGLERASIGKLYFALFEESGKVSAFEDFHDGIAARTEKIGEQIEHAAAKTNGEEVIAVAGGVGGHVGDDNIEELIGGGSKFVGGGFVDVTLDVMNIAAEGVGDRGEIDADDIAPRADKFGSDLHPRAGGAAKIEHGIAGADEFALFLNLFELVGRPSEISLVFGLFEILIVQLARPWGHPKTPIALFGVFINRTVFVFGDPEGLNGFEDALVPGVIGIGSEAGESFDHQFEVGETEADGVDIRVGFDEIFGDEFDIEPAVGSIHGRFSGIGAESSCEIGGRDQ